MSRRLSLVVSLILPLLAAHVAAAASVCDPGSPAAAAPDSPFRTDAPGALRDDERGRILSLEDGRYEDRDGSFVDRRESSPERARLTNAQTVKLLCPPGGEKGESAPRRLEAPKNLPNPRAAGILDFDGAAQRRAGAAATPSGGMAGLSLHAAGAEAAPQLLQAVLSRVKFADDADPRAAAALDRAMRDVLRTPTGQEAAEDFVALNASAEVRFEKLDGTLITINGRKMLSGVHGESRSPDGRAVVVLNRLSLDADQELTSREMAATLAHELFGHALEDQRAVHADFPISALRRYRGDEANGRLIGWLVKTELGAPLSDGGMWSYMQNPERFHSRLALIDPYYAQTFSPAEMADPLPVLRARLEAVRGRRGRLDEDAIDSRKWRIVIKHFVENHGMARSRFSSMSEDIDNFLERERAGLRTASDEVETAIQERIAHLGTPQGREQLRQLSAASRSAHLDSIEKRLARYRTRLGMETRGRKPEALVPPPPDQIDYEGLEKLYQDDLRDNPRHWGL